MDAEHFRTVAEALTQSGRDMLPGSMGFEIVELGPGRASMRVDIRTDHLAPNGYMRAGAVLALADTTAAFGCVANLPEWATTFTIIAWKTHYLATLMDVTLVTEGRMVHGGRTTQLWDVEVLDEATGKTLALFRCTQLILYPRG